MILSACHLLGTKDRDVLSMDFDWIFGSHQRCCDLLVAFILIQCAWLELRNAIVQQSRFLNCVCMLKTCSSTLSAATVLLFDNIGELAIWPQRFDASLLWFWIGFFARLKFVRRLAQHGTRFSLALSIRCPKSWRDCGVFAGRHQR